MKSGLAFSAVTPSLESVAPHNMSLATSATVKPMTLRDCYELGRNQNEQLKIQQEEINQSRFKKNQAIGSVLPDIHWKQSTTWQDTQGTSTNSSADNALFKDQRTESRFTLHQPLFSGFKEFMAIKGFNAAMKRDSYNLNRNNLVLYNDVARSFYDVIAYETELFNIRTNIKLTKDRLKELRERTRVGRSRESEVVTSESTLANLMSNETQSMGQVASAREYLSYLIGQDVTATPLLDNMDVPASVAEQDVVKAAESRSDILALKEDVEYQKYYIRVARAGHSPIVGLDGNYYTKRLGFFKEIDWDLVLNIDVPIFQGGSVSADVKNQISQWKQAKFKLDQQLRFVRSEAKQARIALDSSLQTAELLEDAYKKAKRGYELQSNEYRYGLVSNLDVLQSLSNMLIVKQSWDRALIQTKRDYIQLKTATENFTDKE